MNDYIIKTKGNQFAKFNNFKTKALDMLHLRDILQREFKCSEFELDDSLRKGNIQIIFS